MPLYVYACPRCGVCFERLVPMSRADEAQACLECGTDQTRRAITAAATVGTSRSATAVSAPHSGIT
jgi:putative FmdB family regulatory protein